MVWVYKGAPRCPWSDWRHNPWSFRRILFWIGQWVSGVWGLKEVSGVGQAQKKEKDKENKKEHQDQKLKISARIRILKEETSKYREYQGASIAQGSSRALILNSNGLSDVKYQVYCQISNESKNKSSEIKSKSHQPALGFRLRLKSLLFK